MAYSCADSKCDFNWMLGEFRIASYIPSLSKRFVSDVIDRKYLGHYGSETQELYDISLSENGGVVVKNQDVRFTLPETMINKLLNSDFLSLMIFCLMMTILLESIIVLVFVLLKKAPKKIFFAVLIGNIISVPFVWIVSTAMYSLPGILYITEIIAVVFETWIIKLFVQNRLNWRMCLLVSLIMNVVSFIVSPYLLVLSVSI